MAAYGNSSGASHSRCIRQGQAISGSWAFRVLLSILLALSCRPAAAQAPAPANYAAARGEAVARIVSGIISFTRWPGPPRDARLCITTPAVSAQMLVRNISATTRLAGVQYLAPQDARLESSCDVVYIEHVNEASHANLFQRLAGRPVLTIADSDSGCLMGSLFCISSTGASPVFSVNLDAIARSGLHINPKVLLLVHKQQAK